MKFSLELFAVLALFCHVSLMVRAEDDSDEAIVPPDFYDGATDPSQATLKPEEIEYTVFTNHSGSSALPIHNKYKFLISATGNVEQSYTWSRNMRNAYLSNGFHTVINVVWNKGKEDNYKLCAANAKLAGKYISEYIIANNYPVNEVHLIGLGMGAHVAGFAGKQLKQSGATLARISGLSPPGPSFDRGGAENRLDKTDAAFVDVLHTDIGYFGIATSIGTVDFYPHGGKNQPGCTDKEGAFKNMLCNFFRAYILFTESITVQTLGFPSLSWIALMDEEVQKGSGIIFGEYCPSGAVGDYYFMTRKSSPYLAPVDLKQFTENTGAAYFKNLWKTDY